MPVTMASTINKKLFLSLRILLPKRMMERQIYTDLYMCSKVLQDCNVHIGYGGLGQERGRVKSTSENRQALIEKLNNMPSP